MESIRRYALAIMIILLLAALPGVARAAVSERDLAMAFQWFDTLGYPDVRKLPFVRRPGTLTSIDMASCWPSVDGPQISTKQPFDF